jgi:glycosyltransferase involved in cell wall biosynthesis
VVKGYQDNHGRALNALASIELIAKQEDLNRFQFKVFSASKTVKKKVKWMRHSLGLDIIVLPKMPKSELMEIYKESRVYLGLAISDGLSTSMVEAMSHGVFPIQSSNSSAPEFLMNGVTGGVVDPYDIEGIAAQLMDALLDDDLVDLAAIANVEVVKAKYNWEMGIKKLVEVYE